jgi:hypothetical protein
MKEYECPHVAAPVVFCRHHSCACYCSDPVLAHDVLLLTQIITLDNYADVMHATMAHIHPATAIYFVGIIIIGVYMILNLFLVSQ